MFKSFFFGVIIFTSLAGCVEKDTPDPKFEQTKAFFRSLKTNDIIVVVNEELEVPMKVVSNQESLLKLKDPRTSTYRFIGYYSSNHCTLHDNWICTNATFWLVKPNWPSYNYWAVTFLQLAN